MTVPTRQVSEGWPGGGMVLDYILPLRSSEGCDVRELSEYLHRLCRVAHVIVVDGSHPTVFDAHASLWGHIVTHVRPDPDLTFMNGKVNGVLTGFRLCLSEKVVIADDDVRYEECQLHRMEALLDSAELVRPQNFFDPLPWHARWDSARSLLNRALVGADFPGTLAVRLTPELRSEGYDGDVLFENLELIRTVQARGGREHVVLDLFIRRRPPTTRHFAGQRVRQAYDSFAQPARMALELALLPLLCVCALRRKLIPLLALAVATAEAGRWRGRADARYPPSTSLFAPAWMVERAVCSWLAVLQRARGGMRYADRQIVRAAHTAHELKESGARGAPPQELDADPALQEERNSDVKSHLPPSL